MEVVAAIDASESPIEASLVFVMAGTEFSEFTFSIGGDNGVKVGASGGASDLGENGLFGVTAVNGDEASLGVVVETQVVGGHKGS